MPLTDTEQRQQAIDPAQSFIVQAPAGSGKTELLSQRFLKLLSVVEQPEHIVALTFTRKAASEMKERILASLRKAHNNTCGDSPHQQSTFNLAKAALAQDNQQQWQLLRSPHRLRIMTIDALCQRLSNAIPLLDKALPFAEITDAPQLAYEQAARNCLRDALSDKRLQGPIYSLLEHLDNQQDRLLALFSDLLSCREQWLQVIFRAKQLQQHDFEEALQHIEDHLLERLVNSIPEEYQQTICALSQHIATLENKPDSPRYVLRNWFDFQDLDRDIAQGLAHLFLTQDDHIRKALDHYVGLKKDCGPDYQSLKQQGQILCNLLRDLPDCATILAQAKRLPPPYYTAAQWQVLQALFTLLPLLVAQLHLVFQKTNTLDFTAITQQAITGLGDEEEPTDLTLYLDHTIHHLLIDEFQDTSIQQIQLIEKLVQHWLPDEPKSLFLVGDPMQSIYRFRQAEVGLFLKVREQGIGPLALTSIELSSNFRSTGTIIQWINTHFTHIFPHLEDIESGAIAFHPSTAVLPATEDSGIHAAQYADKIAEARAIVKLIHQLNLQFPDQSIAILVRSRHQLTEIILQLRQTNTAFQGVDINPLAGLAHLRDMWSLTEALLYPADRLSWLALLRSPYGGLLLEDLQILANFAPKKSIYHALLNLQELPTLSDEGQKRCRYIAHVMEHALATRHQRPILDWVIHTAQQLHADLIVQPHQRVELEQFWQLLEQHLQRVSFPDLKTLSDEFAKLYSKNSIPATLQIMTIHKAKGLEFDTVIIPGVSNKANPPDNPLIRWLKLPSQQQHDYLLVSPIKAAHETESALYQYLHDVEAEKAQYEMQRLLYVAATRAKKRLYLFDNQDRQNKGSFRDLLCQQEFQEHANQEALDSAVKPRGYDDTPQSYDHKPQEYAGTEEIVPSRPTLIRLHHEVYENLPKSPATITNIVAPPTAQGFARQLGIISHEILQWICTYHPTSTQHLPWLLIEQRCRQQGLENDEINAVKQRIKEQLEQLFADTIGQWICKPHTDEKNEYALLVNEHEQVKTRVIDRTFVDQGLRWIIDFKTGTDDDSKLKQHQQQVNYYAELLRPSSNLPLHCGIFYLANTRWVHWAYTAVEMSI